MTGVFITLIICASIVFIFYMNYCYEAGVGMFADPHYYERIKALEKRLYEMEEKLNEIKQSS